MPNETTGWTRNRQTPSTCVKPVYIFHSPRTAPRRSRRRPRLTQAWKPRNADRRENRRRLSTIENKGAATDGCRGGGGVRRYDGKVEVHEMTLNNGVRRLRRSKGADDRARQGTVKLAPGGLYERFDLKGQLKTRATRGR